MTSATDGGDEALGVDGSWLARNWPYLVIAVLASLPALRMLSWITSGTHVQFSDYWVFISELINPDGSVRWGALSEFQGQHILSVPFLIYLLNIWLFGGSNITLGFIVVAIVAVQLWVLWSWIRRLERLPLIAHGALLILASAVLYSPYGAWNFLRAMSGTAWLTANLVAILAIHLATRDRTLAATALALVATITYGTGVMVWPVLILVLVLRRRPRVEIAAVLAVGAAVVVAYVIVRSSQVEADTVRSVDYWDAFMLMARINGRLAGLHPDVVVATGLLALLAVAILGPLAVLRARDQALPFVGLAFFSILSTAQIAYGRSGISLGGATDLGRYTSLGAVLLVAICGLALCILGTIDRVDVRGGATAVVLVSMVLVAVSAPFRGQGQLERSAESDKRLVHMSDAQRAKVSRGVAWFPLFSQPDIDDRLERIGHHPFDGRWNADCGLMGHEFEGSTERIDGRALIQRSDSMPDGVRVNVGAALASEEVKCLVVVDHGGLVVGAGRVAVVGSSAADRISLIAYAPVDSEPARAIIGTRDDRWLELPVLDNSQS